MITASYDISFQTASASSNVETHRHAYLLDKPFSTSDLKRVLERLWQEPKGLIGARERALNQATLTNKECEVARLLLKGLSTQEMARLTGNSEKTLKQHISTIYDPQHFMADTRRPQQYADDGDHVEDHYNGPQKRV